MPVIVYNDLNPFLDSATAADWPAVTLICGEEMLCRKAYTAALDILMPPADRAVGVDLFDGAGDSIDRMLSGLNTYALLANRKVVVWQDARVFYSAKTRQGLQEKMVKAAQSGDMKKASRPFLSLMALRGLQFEDLATPALKKKILDSLDQEPSEWLDTLVAYCRDKGLAVPDQQDDGDRLLAAMQKGFPAGHRLIITTDMVDRRKALYKAIADTGLVFDCTVPRGETRSDRTAQDAATRAIIDEALRLSGKRLAPDARRRLMTLTGFDLRTLAGSMEKLISYVGGRETISRDDVAALLPRTRKDPIFAFTNAVADRDLAGSLFYMNTLLTDGFHPLQLLAAAANQIRRLLVAKDFMIRDRGRTWSAGMTFAQFKTGPFKAMQADDALLFERLAQWDRALRPSSDAIRSKPKVHSDLSLVKNPKSPYPVFQTLVRADAFSREALQNAVIDLAETDRRMKATGQAPQLLMETFLIRFCRR